VSKRSDPRPEPDALLPSVHAVLAGVPAVYVVSGSIKVTAIAAGAAVAVAVTHRLRGRG
jgi:hypothetical protein